MHVEQTFRVDAPPERVFDYMTDPGNLKAWQTTKTSVEQVTPGPPGLGTRIRERTKPPGGREFEQVVEFTEFERPRRFTTHIVEGPQPIDGTWTMEPAGDATQVTFVADGEIRGPMRFLGPVVKRMIGRQFAGYHETLRRNVEAQRG
jgi:carbon monoxide dehydrogenase subunit G